MTVISENRGRGQQHLLHQEPPAMNGNDLAQQPQQTGRRKENRDAGGGGKEQELVEEVVEETGGGQEQVLVEEVVEEEEEAEVEVVVKEEENTSASSVDDDDGLKLAIALTPSAKVEGSDNWKDIKLNTLFLQHQDRFVLVQTTPSNEKKLEKTIDFFAKILIRKGSESFQSFCGPGLPAKEIANWIQEQQQKVEKDFSTYQHSNPSGLVMVGVMVVVICIWLE